jgi:inorganic pyrophosphatase/exopolyphosphatase
MNLDQDDYEVEKILDKKVFNGKTLYLVKWKHFPVSDATWESNKILLSAKDKIKQFKSTKKASENLTDIKL